MGRLGRILLWAIGLLCGLVILVLLVVLIGANIGPGRRLIQREAASLTGGKVTITGLHGFFPNALAINTVTLSDTNGPYAVLDGIKLDWRPWDLIGLVAHVDLASVDTITVQRKPVPNPNAPKPPPPKSSKSSLPNLGIDIARLHVGRLTLGAAVAGVPAALAIDGHLKVQGTAPLLNGASVASLPNSDIALAVTRLDHPGSVNLAAKATPGRLGLHVQASDPKGGLATSAGGLADLDPLTLALDLAGPRDHEALHLALTAGPATLDAAGTTDLLTRHFDVTAHGHAPAMQPRPGLSWKDIALDAHLTGTPGAPVGSGHLLVDTLAAPGGGVNRLTATFSGSRVGPAILHAVADGLRVPGKQPGLFAADPLTVDATLHQEQPGRPIDLIVTHPLAQVTGDILTTPDIRGHLGITLPQLGPLAAAAGTALDGHAALATNFSYAHRIAVVGLGGTFALTGGPAQAVGLIGDDGRIGLTASVVPTTQGRDLRLYGLTLHGRALDLDAKGRDLANTLDARFGLHLPELAAALPSLRGALSVNGTAGGKLDDLSTKIDATGTVGTAKIPTGPMHLVLDASHLPHAPQGTLTLDGTLDRAPLWLAAEIQRQPSGATHIALERLGWKSASGHANLTLPAGAALPLGDLDLRMTRLADLAPLVGQPVRGHLDTSLHTTQADGAAHPTARLDVAGAVASRSFGVSRLKLAGTVVDPAGSPDLDLALTADSIHANSVTGSAHVTARGPEQAIAVAASGRFEHVAGAPARLDTDLVADVPDKHVAISHLFATAKSEVIRLLAPTRISYGPEISVDHMRASVAPASGAPGSVNAAPAMIDVAGKLSPELDLTASVTNVTPALAKPFAPTLNATGVIALQAKLTGTTSRPDGTVHFTARSMQLRTGPAASLPPATLDARADLAGGEARIDAHLDAGPQVRLALTGTAPTDTTGQLDLRARGTIDLAIANPVLGAEGRRAAGRLALDMTATGTPQAPDLAGQVRVAHGEIQDFAQGLRLTDMTALITARGKTISIDNFVAHAGPGTINASGTVGALQPGLPVDLHITANKARPISSDLLTAILDMDLTVKGQAATRVDLGGLITIDSASINVPSGLPPSVAKLDVIRPGQKPPSATSASAGPIIGLDLTLNAPGQIFVRGHGLDVELGGKLTVGGTSKAPVVRGGFKMRDGTFSLAGVNLTFTKGQISFNGTSVTNKIDPSLDLTADSFVGNTVAMLHVGGYASAPKITLSSTPPLPPDQVLALILFQQSTTQLSPLQIASVAAALAQLSGVGGGGPGILDRVRSGLGLDRLSVGSGGANSSGASVQAGKYVARGVYVGARQSTSGAGTQAQVEVNLTRHLKLNTVVGTGGTVTGTTTPENDPGSSVGLKYEFQY
ncbi:translocation/assembly module TamB domain-containing protein [Lichenicoccus sp.]|uniref:translocation/assembly module TamB domain-containing protein n=1 Tax=Lichenicoccus sp. TaxID=2781899 RepID=UPI003D0FF650